MITVRAQKWLVGILLSIGILIIAVAPVTLASQEGEFKANIDWQKFAGTRLKVAMCSHPATRFLEPILGEFEALTGMDISFDTYETDALRQKMQTEMMAGKAIHNAFMLHLAPMHSWVSHGWIEDIVPYLNNPEFTDKSWYDFDDFIPSFGKFAKGMDPSMPWQLEPDELWGIPLDAYTSILYYRKDLYKKYGIYKTPTSFPELYEQIGKLTLPENGVYGYVGRRRRAHAGHHWTQYLISWGGHWFDENMNPGIDSPEAIEAYKFYQSLEQFATPGIADLNYPECLSEYAAGRAAFWIDMGFGQSTLEDPSLSKVVGKVGYAPCPVGKAGLKSYGWSWLLAIPSTAKNKEAAWYFIQWATSKEVYLKGLMDIGCPRASVTNSKKFAERNAKDWVYTTSLMAQPAIFSAAPVPLVERSSELMDSLGIEMGYVTAGIKTPVEAMRAAGKKWREIAAELK